ncbi:MAG: transposase [Gammaproteobacteria bacterium]|nr:transposase [Gammaproteobacteria bacterium]
MPRRTRMYIPGLPYHIVQRGNNRKACFVEPENYRFYLQLWQELSLRYRAGVHAYCLMTNHIHFLATPETETSLSNVMKVVGSRYAQYFNKKYHRTGTLWEGRHKSSLVESERYLLTCMRYIELNPVRASMVNKPEEYSWSSYGANGCGDESWLVPHDDYLRIDRDPGKRCYRYRELFKDRVNQKDLHLIRKATHYCQPVGDDRFRKSIEKKYNIKLGQMSRGRPAKK